MRLAAIDIGSNSIKLVVVEAAAADSFAVLARERDVVRLGHDTLRAGFIAPAAVERAALLHDAGYHIAHEEHHKQSLYLVKHSELTGFSEAERSVVANVARYHRGAPPRERHPDYAALGEQDRRTVCHLAAVLRLADALDRSYDSRVRDLSLTRDGEVARLCLLSPHDCAREISAAEQKRDLFEQVFGGQLEISLESGVWSPESWQRDSQILS